jgi:nucleoid-associated protein YgaU
MPNDAKLGLVLGVGLVIAVGVVFYRKDLATTPTPDRATGTVNGPAAPPPPNAVRDQLHQVEAHTAERTTTSTSADPSIRRHTVRDGDTLFTVAREYYGDGDRFVDLYRANRDVLKRPDALEPGTVLVVPELP